MHTTIHEMLRANPKAADKAIPKLLSDCADTCSECELACNACADACLAEEDLSALRRSIRLNLDCADVCAATSLADAAGSEEAFRKLSSADCRGTASGGQAFCREGRSSRTIRAIGWLSPRIRLRRMTDAIML